MPCQHHRCTAAIGSGHQDPVKLLARFGRKVTAELIAQDDVWAKIAWRLGWLGVKRRR